MQKQDQVILADVSLKKVVPTTFSGVVNWRKS